MEAVEAGVGMPDWLTKSIIEDRKLMVIHPTEASRKEAIEKLHSLMNGGIVDSSHHLTLERFISLLHLDLRLPAAMEDDGVTFELTHRALSSHAKQYGFPLIQPNPQHKWTRSRTQRILALHSKIIGLLKPQYWEEDPGAMVCDQVIKKLEKERGMTHPSRVERVVFEALKISNKIPFTLRGVDGIVMLDHASSLTEIEISILGQISKLVNFHQLVNPGSHRLGFHGEYIEDIHPIRSEKELPKWIPKHTIWSPKGDQEWRSPSSNSEIFHLMVESEAQIVSALGDILSRVDGDVMIVDGDASSLQKNIKSYLNHFGIRLRGTSTPLSSSPSVSRILAIIDISRGEEAWSLNRLRDLDEQTSLPLSWELLKLKHPLHEGWSPKIHPETLVEIARSFHVLGGRGSLRRWLSTLSNAEPRIVGDENQARALEESQWWLASIARWMNSILPESDRITAMETCIGCISGQELPLPESPENPLLWFNSMLKQIDWIQLTKRDTIESNSIPGLQYLVDSISRLNQETSLSFEEDDFSEMFHNLSSNTKIPSRRGSDIGLRILNPDQALGTTSEILILSGMDSQTWSMKPPSIPWLDEISRMRLGINRPDSGLRKGRHYLRHLLNSGKTVIILDSSLEEGIEPSGPLEEWFSIISRNKSEVNLEIPPPFLSLEDWSPKFPDRAWCWRTISDVGLRLVHKVSSMEMLIDGVRTHRSGILPRDEKQRTGLALIEKRKSKALLNPNSIITAAKSELIPDQFARRTITLGAGERFRFDQSGSLVRTYDYDLIPKRTLPANSRKSPIWPHLGYHTETETTLGIDPRPIQPPSTGIELIDARIGLSPVNIKTPKIWSQSRLQAWLDCPRKAWYERHLKLGKEENIPEDLAANARGNVVHYVAEAILQAHNQDSNDLPTELNPLQEGPLKDANKAWKIVLETLIDKAPWMKRADGISAHRCRDLVGVSPIRWNSWLKGEDTIPIGGRLGRMLLSDYAMNDCAPMASEWQIENENRKNVMINLPPSPEEDGIEKRFKFTGIIDRVDAIIVDYDLKKNAEIVPLDFNTNQKIPVSQLVIIRDIKSVDGPRDNGKDARHLKGLFDELQLALYARSWEICNPGHRVVGVGVTQVGIETQTWVEIDPDFVELLQDKSIGTITQKLVNQYRRPGEDHNPKSNPFRAWMRERITTANRVIDNVKEGLIPCNCSTIDSCRSLKRGGW
ncbi:MAG: PD-(D/E)XK nuclease family protein [Candidatus Poseidoniaceae archaeon]|nr:PD-(D/E)XK nuclease family protein [Candidatus Poseidoniaceae archaeon]